MIRAGIGFDAHPFTDERTLRLGGVDVHDAPGLQGHSDGDVLSHAVADALLGAAGLGDLGAMFPNDDRWRGASSLRILEATLGAVADAGWAICNVDATVIAEAPRLEPYRGPMRDNIAEALGVSSADVSVKATTTDRLGFTGRSEGMAAVAVVLIERRGD